MKNFFKGFVVGIGKIIPGVSGAMLAISMGIYDKSIDYICNFRNNKKESIKYLFPIGLGLILSIIFFSNVISLLLDKFYFVTMFFFIGLIIGGLPSIVDKVDKKEYFISVISFVSLFGISILGIDNVYVIGGGIRDFIVFFLSGIVEAIGTVVPGISSSALLMVMGTYNSVIEAISVIDIKILIPFGIGLLVGVIFTVRFINFLFNRFENRVYAFVLGVLLSSILLLIIKAFVVRVSVLKLIIGCVFMCGGIVISYFFKEK